MSTEQKIQELESLSSIVCEIPAQYNHATERERVSPGRVRNCEGRKMPNYILNLITTVSYINIYYMYYILIYSAYNIQIYYNIIYKIT